MRMAAALPRLPFGLDALLRQQDPRNAETSPIIFTSQGIIEENATSQKVVFLPTDVFPWVGHNVGHSQLTGACR